MSEGPTRGLSGGVNQSGVRDYNERLLLTLLQRGGACAGSELARQSGLSPQTVSIILREMEADGLLKRGAPQRGKVGKPSIPMMLDPDGVFSFGLKIGRRSCDVVLADFTGSIRDRRSMTYPYPLPEQVFGFLETAMADMTAGLAPELRSRICGLGVAMPFELWRWDVAGSAQAGSAQGEESQGEDFLSWRGVDVPAVVARFSDLPVIVGNDATAACRAEHMYGRGKEFSDYAYFFVGVFVGGGIVLNNSVYEGAHGNAGALGSLRTSGPQGESLQLIDTASIHLLEARLVEANLDPVSLWRMPQDWEPYVRYVEPWIGRTAQELARAALSTCAVIDFEAILIDGGFPAQVRTSLVARTRRYLEDLDMRGMHRPRIEEGAVGGNARAIGATTIPLLNRFFLDSNARNSAF